MEQSFQQGNCASEWSSYVKTRQTPTNSFQHVLLMLLWCFWIVEVSSLFRTNEKFGWKIKVSRGGCWGWGRVWICSVFFLIDYKTLTYLHVSWDNRRRHEMWMKILRWKYLALWKMMMKMKTQHAKISASSRRSEEITWKISVQFRLESRSPN